MNRKVLRIWAAREVPAANLARWCDTVGAGFTPGDVEQVRAVPADAAELVALVRHHGATVLVADPVDRKLVRAALDELTALGVEVWVMHQTETHRNRGGRVRPVLSPRTYRRVAHHSDLDGRPVA